MSLKSGIAAAALLGLALSACSGGGDGGDEKAYCADLKTSASKVEALAGGDLAGLDEAFAKAHDLADEAPSDVRKDWKTVDDAVTDVQTSLKAAGLKASDIAKVQAGGDIPDGVDLTKLADLSKVYAEITGAKFTAAQESIVAHARKACGVEIDVS